jgi:hypothetical protein
LSVPSADLDVVILFPALVLALAGLAFLRARRRRLERARVRHRKLSPDELSRMSRLAPLCKRIPTALRERWEGAVRLFLAEKTFVECQGLEVDGDLRLAVAGQACLLLLGKGDWDVYPDLTTIYLHPTSYVRRDERSLGGGASIRQEGIAYDGESWTRGAVVLSAAAVRHGSIEMDGFNVVLHELAHQFDAMDGVTDGCPPMPSELRPEWAKTMLSEFEAHRHAVARGHHTFLDPYGAENPAEFFAVCVETFFELPGALRETHPDIHRLFAAVFGTDPEKW